VECPNTFPEGEACPAEQKDGDELHWMEVGSTAGVISGLSPGTEKAGEDL
jgi:hypothetical protein